MLSAMVGVDGQQGSARRVQGAGQQRLQTEQVDKLSLVDLNRGGGVGEGGEGGEGEERPNSFWQFPDGFRLASPHTCLHS